MKFVDDPTEYEATISVVAECAHGSFIVWWMKDEPAHPLHRIFLLFGENNDDVEYFMVGGRKITG